MAVFAALDAALSGNVRGHPVGISLFADAIPTSYAARKVVPCAIVRLAMDDGEICYFDGAHQDCMTGAFTAGVHEGTDAIRTGRYLADNIPAMSEIAAARGKSGRNVLPADTVTAIGAAPLDRIPEGVDVDWIVVVCNPQWAGWIASARSVIDGTPPEAAAGTSFCSELFAVPWHTDNVVMTPGDMGGRMNNRLKPEEMFVIVPSRYAESLLHIVTDSLRNIDARATLDATKPPDSPYWQKRRRVAARASTGDPASPDGPQFSLDWDDEARGLIGKMPAGLVDVAVATVEEFARENGHERVTRAVVEAQMKSIGMDPASVWNG